MIWKTFHLLVLSLLFRLSVAGILPSLPLLPSIYGLSNSEQRDMITNMNFMRGLHVNTPAISWSSSAAGAATDKMGNYNCNGGNVISNDDYGYTVYVGTGGVADAVASWYNGVNYYDFSDPQINGQDRDFIQLVWAQSTSVGCAKRTCGSNTVYLCQYYLPGVYKDILTYNVQQLKAQTSTDTKTETQSVFDTSTATETVLTVETATVTDVTVSINELTKNHTNTNTVTYTQVTTDIHTMNVTSVNTETYTDITTATTTMNHTSTETVVESKEVTTILTNNVTSLLTVNMTMIHTTTFTVVSKDIHTRNMTSYDTTTYTKMATDTLTLNLTTTETVIDSTTETVYMPTEVTRTFTSNITTVETLTIIQPHTIQSVVTSNHTQTEVLSLASNVTITSTVTETYIHTEKDNVTYIESTIIPTTTTVFFTHGNNATNNLLPTVTKTEISVVTSTILEPIIVTQNHTQLYTPVDANTDSLTSNSINTVTETAYVTMMSNNTVTQTITPTASSIMDLTETVSNIRISTTTIYDNQTTIVTYVSVVTNTVSADTVAIDRTVTITVIVHDTVAPVTVTVDNIIENTVTVIYTVSPSTVTVDRIIDTTVTINKTVTDTVYLKPTDVIPEQGIPHPSLTDANIASQSSDTLSPGSDSTTSSMLTSSSFYDDGGIQSGNITTDQTGVTTALGLTSETNSWVSASASDGISGSATASFIPTSSVAVASSVTSTYEKINSQSTGAEYSSQENTRSLASSEQLSYTSSNSDNVELTTRMTSASTPLMTYDGHSQTKDANSATGTGFTSVSSLSFTTFTNGNEHPTSTTVLASSVVTPDTTSSTQVLSSMIVTDTDTSGVQEYSGVESMVGTVTSGLYSSSQLIPTTSKQSQFSVPPRSLEAGVDAQVITGSSGFASTSSALSTYSESPTVVSAGSNVPSGYIQTTVTNPASIVSGSNVGLLDATSKSAVSEGISSVVNDLAKRVSKNGEDGNAEDTSILGNLVNQDVSMMMSTVVENAISTGIKEPPQLTSEYSMPQSSTTNSLPSDTPHGTIGVSSASDYLSWDDPTSTLPSKTAAVSTTAINGIASNNEVRNLPGIWKSIVPVLMLTLQVV